MAQVKTKFLEPSAVDDTKVRLRNNQHLRARNAADSADISMLKVNASDRVEFASLPQVTTDPVAANDLARKSYVDSLTGSMIDPKESVRAATTANITLSGAQTIDGVSVIAGDRVLVKNQTTGSENGLYLAAAGAWSRTSDANTSAEVTANMFVFIEEGTLYADTGWLLSTNNPITLDTTALVFVQFSSAGVILAGSGLTKTGNTLSVNANKENLTLNGTDITNQYKDLAFESKPNTLMLSVDGVVQYEGTEYTLSTVSNVTRITFAGGLATGGASELISGDILRCQYLYL